MGLMVFFKRKKKPSEDLKSAKLEVNNEQIMQEVEILLPKLEKAEDTDRIDVLNKLGSLYFQLNEIDKSIAYYETSISENKTLGKAFTDLVKLYNIKRKEAAAEKDSEKVQLYLNKSDDLMKLTKDSIRGRI
jgi:tetratricopeptide (TPR) repeat protein